MTDIPRTQRSPLEGHLSARRSGRRDGSVGVTVVSARYRAVAAIVAREGQRSRLAAAVLHEFALALPERPCRNAGRGVFAQWNGPDRWLLQFESEPDGGVESHLTSRLGEHATIIDQSHATFHLRVSGPRIRDVLAKGFAVDLHERSFRAGDVALTVVAHVPVSIGQLDSAPTYEILGPRSVAVSFWRWLEASAGEFGLEVVDATC